jgi:glucokinase
LSIPPFVLKIIARSDLTLALLAFTVAASTTCGLPLVALPAGGMFLAGGVYFTLEQEIKDMKKKKFKKKEN